MSALAGLCRGLHSQNRSPYKLDEDEQSLGARV